MNRTRVKSEADKATLARFMEWLYHKASKIEVIKMMRHVEHALIDGQVHVDGPVYSPTCIHVLVADEEGIIEQRKYYIENDNVDCLYLL